MTLESHQVILHTALNTRNLIINNNEITTLRRPVVFALYNFDFVRPFETLEFNKQ